MTNAAKDAKLTNVETIYYNQKKETVIVTSVGFVWIHAHDAATQSKSEQALEGKRAKESHRKLGRSDPVDPWAQALRIRWPDVAIRSLFLLNLKTGKG